MNSALEIIGDTRQGESKMNDMHWDGPSNTVTQLYAFAKAMVGGSKDAFGENAKLEF